MLIRCELCGTNNEVNAEVTGQHPPCRNCGCSLVVRGGVDVLPLATEASPEPRAGGCSGYPTKTVLSLFSSAFFFSVSRFVVYMDRAPWASYLRTDGTMNSVLWLGSWAGALVAGHVFLLAGGFFWMMGKGRSPWLALILIPGSLGFCILPLAYDGLWLALFPGIPIITLIVFGFIPDRYKALDPPLDPVQLAKEEKRKNLVLFVALALIVLCVLYVLAMVVMGIRVQAP